MGVNQQLIIMIGCNVEEEVYQKAGGFDKFETLAIDEEGKENTNRIVVISDGMNGDYCMVGIPSYVSGRYEQFSDLSNNEEHNGLQIKELTPPSKEQIEEIKKFIKDKFGIKDIKINHYIFIHYT